MHVEIDTTGKPARTWRWLWWVLALGVIAGALYFFVADSAFVATTPQRPGGGISAPVTKDSFREMTLAQGSGWHGFDTLRIYADGTGYAVIGKDHEGAAKLPITLPEPAMQELMAALNADHVGRLKGSYSIGIHDGSQGFVQVMTANGTVTSWLDNYFTPLHHLYEFAEKHVWNEIRLQQQPPGLDRNYDRQAEYYRVFPKRTR